MDEGSCKWALQEFEKLLSDYDIPLPPFFLTDTGDTFLKACSEVLPSVHVQIDVGKRNQDAWDHLRHYFDGDELQRDLFNVWKRCTSSELAERTQAFAYINNHQSDQLRSVWRVLDKRGHLVPVVHERPFFLLPMKAYDYKYVERAYKSSAKAVEMVLEKMVSRYEELDEINGKNLAKVENNDRYRHCFDNVLYYISEKALLTVRNGITSKCSTGLPVLEEVHRDLAVDDFHPRWRNVFASLQDLPLSGGRYYFQWKSLQTGMGFFDKRRQEGECEVDDEGTERKPVEVE